MGRLKAVAMEIERLEAEDNLDDYQELIDAYQELFALAAEGVKVTAKKVVEKAAKLATELEDSGTVIPPEKH
jgi:hypothetical protein